MTGFADLVAGGVITENVPLGPMTTYRFGGPARYLLDAEGEDQVLQVARALRSEPMPVAALGRGSNVVISELGFPGLVIRPGAGMNYCRIGRDGGVAAGAALPLPMLARRAAEQGRGGLEFYVGIPGSVGGAVRMNAGCHGSDTAGCLGAARVVDLESATVVERTPIDLEMSYRHSNLRPTEVVVSAEFVTVARDPAECDAELRAVTRWRKENQPGGTLNAGSVFKNPPGDAAGRIIDDLGLKGFTIGGVSVSERHANFFVAGADATAQEVFDLVAAVRQRVRSATGIELVPEVQFLGDFEGHL